MKTPTIVLLLFCQCLNHSTGARFGFVFLLDVDRINAQLVKCRQSDPRIPRVDTSTCLSLCSQTPFRLISNLPFREKHCFRLKYCRNVWKSVYFQR